MLVLVLFSGGVIVVVVAMVVVVLYSGGGSTLASRPPPVSMLALWALWVQNYFTALFSWVIFQDHIHIVSCSEKCQTITTQVPLVLLLASSTTLANLLPGQSTHHGHGVGGVEQGNHHAADHQAENAQHHLPKGPRRTVLNRNGRKVRVVFWILIQVSIIQILYFDQSQHLYRDLQCWTYKSGLKIFVPAPEVPFLGAFSTFGWVFSPFRNLVLFWPFLSRFPISTNRPTNICHPLWSPSETFCEIRATLMDSIHSNPYPGIPCR